MIYYFLIVIYLILVVISYILVKREFKKLFEKIDPETSDLWMQRDRIYCLVISLLIAPGMIILLPIILLSSLVKSIKNKIVLSRKVDNFLKKPAKW